MAIFNFFGAPKTEEYEILKNFRDELLQLDSCVGMSSGQTTGNINIKKDIDGFKNIFQKNKEDFVVEINKIQKYNLGDEKLNQILENLKNGLSTNPMETIYDIKDFRILMNNFFVYFKKNERSLKKIKSYSMAA